MFKKRAQGLSINVIIVAVIGLIILVVVIAMFTGRIDLYSSGVKELTTCENTCKNIGADAGVNLNELACKSLSDDNQFLPGTYSDAPDGCCCF